MKYYLYIYVVIFLILNNTYSLYPQMMNINPENIGRSVNSIYEERAPVISPDGQTLYFIRQGHPQNIGENKNNQDIWISNRLPNGQWSTAKNIGRPMNNEGSNGVMSVTPDGNTILLFGTYNTKDNPGGASISHFKSGKWSFPEALEIERYHNYSRWFQFYLCNDSKTLVMAIETDNSMGENDLYVSFLKDNGNWSVPMNMGKQVNTDGNELSPFIASDGTTLYFSTDGRNGLGGYDVFLSRRLDNTWLNWSEPENLGPGINTDGFDAYYKISAAGKYAYFTSTKNSYGAGDIFRIALPERLKPKPVVLVYGKVLNAITKEAIEADVFYESLPDNHTGGIAKSRINTGEYKITLPAGSLYGFRAEAEGFISINTSIDLQSLKKYREIERNLELIPLDSGSTVILNNIFFDFGEAILKPESFPELDRIVELLKSNSCMVIEIVGHTDDRGTSEYNFSLSENRAKAVVEYLISNHIQKSRLSYHGYGEELPISDNDTEEGRQKNRRVEFKILKR